MRSNTSLLGRIFFMDRIIDARNLNENLEKNLKQTSVFSVWSVDLFYRLNY